MPSAKVLFNILLVISLLLVLAVFISLQYINPYLHGVDGYYHIRIPSFIKEYGLDYEFSWAQFSTFRHTFSDKEILFHILIIPFTLLKIGIHAQAKLAVIFFILLLLLTYLYVLRKYATRPIQILALLALPLSTLFITYANYLRPKTMAISLILLLLVFLSEKKYLGIFIICLLYPLTHISFPLAMVFVLGTETLRYFYRREFDGRTIIYSIVGLALGTFLHPNYPDNLVSLHLNAVLVPWNTMFGDLQLNYGVEWNPANTRAVVLDFLVLITGLGTTFYILLLRRPQIRFATIVFFFATSFFFLLSMFSVAYWYLTYPLGILFLALFFSDYLHAKSQFLKTSFLCISVLLLSLSAFLIYKSGKLADNTTAHLLKNAHYERMARWMAEHLPPGKTIYHSGWSDSPYFICFNPKDYYFVVLDPIYMHYYSKSVYEQYSNLALGKYDNPYEVLKDSFQVEYGYTRKEYPLYQQIIDDDRFQIIFEDNEGLIFRLS